MRNKLLNLIVASLLLTFFASCSSNTSANLIPEDASIVASFDVVSSFKTIGDDQIEKLSKELKKMFKDTDLGRDERNKINEIIDDPMILGIDLLKPIYVSADVEGEIFYFIGSIRNITDFENTVGYLASELDSEIDEEGDVKYVALDGVMVMFNEKSFVIGEIFGEYDYQQNAYVDDVYKTVDDMMALFTQKKSFADTKSYKLLDGEKGLVKMVMTPEFLSMVSSMSAEEFEDSGVDFSEYEKLYEDMNMVLAMNVEKGKMTMSALCDVGENSDMLEKYTSMYGTIEGSHLQYVNNDAVFVAAANLNVQNIWNYVLDALKAQLGDSFDVMFANIENELEQEYGVKLNDVIESCNGDITFVMDGDFLGRDCIPAFDLYVSAKNNKLATLASTLLGMDELSGDKWETSYTEWNYVYDEYVDVANLSIEHKDNASCLSFNDKDNSFKAASEMIDESLFKSKLSYARLNVQSLLNSKMEGEKIKNIIKEDEPIMMLELVESVDYIDIASETNRVECNLYTIDKTKTPINIFIDFIMNMI